MWVEIFTTAFVLQLMALPGEKGQFVVAGLATKYRPAVVVAGAGTAFAGWTVLEIWLGNALRGTLPEVYLDVATAALFALFAAWLIYTEPVGGTGDIADGVTDGGTTVGSPSADDATTSVAAGGSSFDPDGRFYGFFPAFGMMALGEFGDKTQLVTIGLATTYGASSAIWFGEMAAIIPFSAANAYFFDRFAHRIDAVWLHRLSAGVFLLFALDIVAAYAFGHSFLPM